MADAKAKLRLIGDEIDPIIAVMFKFFKDEGFREMVARFFKDGEQGQKLNVNAMPVADVRQLRQRLDDEGIVVTCNGTAVLKRELVAGAGLGDPFLSLPEFRESLKPVAEVSSILGCKANRIFTGYSPRGKEPGPHLQQSIDYTGAAVEVFAAAGQVSIIEIEPNLVGRRSSQLAAIVEAINKPNFVGVAFDPANVLVLGKDANGVLSTFAGLAPHVVEFHVKDHEQIAADKLREGQWPDDFVPEGELTNFRVAGEGGSGFPELLASLKGSWERFAGNAERLGLPFYFSMEPHLASGGERGGTSGPDGMKKAIAAFTALLDTAGIPWEK